MNFLIADTFTDSLAKLSGDEQKAAKTTAFDLQLNPANPGMSFHKLDKARDKNFWSVRASSDIRLIVHKTDASLLLCYVDHHDKAYDWAERRKLETHPQTGAAQLVEIRETVQEIIVPKYVEEIRYPAPKPPLFAHIAAEVLLSYGVPQEWLTDVQQANEDSLLDLAGHLPGEEAEALLELATGGKPQVLPPVAAGADPFAHPDAQRVLLWGIFDFVRNTLRSQGLITHAEMFSQLATQIAERRNPPFDFAVMDEAQDVSIAQLRFLAAMGAWRPDALFFAGDLGQRIFQQPFSWKSIGVDIRGRSRTLHINYRTSSDQDAGRPLAGAGSLRCGRQLGRPARHGVGVQWNRTNPIPVSPQSHA